MPCSVDPSGHVLREAGTPVDAVDTTGAGDTFDAAYLDSFLRGLDPQECLRRACVAGAISTSAARRHRRPADHRPALTTRKGRRCPTSALRSSRSRTPGGGPWTLLPSVSRRAAEPGGARRGDRLRHVLVHGRGVRRAARGRRTGGDRLLHREPAALVADLRPRARHQPLGYDDRGARRAGRDQRLVVRRSSPTPRRRWRQVSDDCVVLDFADEQSVVQTVFATTTLMLLRASLGESVEHVIAETERVLSEAPDPQRATRRRSSPSSARAGPTASPARPR